MFEIKVISVNKKGIAKCSYKYDKEFLSYYRSETGRKKIVESEVSQFIETYIINTFEDLDLNKPTPKKRRK